MGQIYADNHPDTFEPACVKEKKRADVWQTVMTDTGKKGCSMLKFNIQQNTNK